MKRSGDGAGGWRGAAAPALLVALVLPAILWRAGLESSLWIDEVYSLQIVHLAPAQIVDLTTRDSHPPGYYLALKGWLKAARLAGIEPGVAWARGMGVAVWLALVAAVWGMVRRLGGASSAGLAVWAVCGAAVAAALAVQLRGYVLVLAAVVVAFLAALLAEREARAGEGRQAVAWWALYALMAAAALWTHLLAAPLLAVLAIAWVAVVAAVPAPRRWRRLALGAAAHLAAAVSFLPWLARVPGQLGAFERSGTDWMTPPTGRQLSFVFTYWFPVGPVALPDVPPYAWLNLLGAAALLVPLAAAGLALARRRAGRVGPLAAAAAAVAGVFAVLLWALDRYGVASVFHGPRYPLLAAGLWGLGLAGLALAGGGLAAGELVNRSPAVASAAGRSSLHQLSRRRRLAWLLLAPWLAAAAAGHLLALRQEARGGLPAARPAIEATLGAPGEPIYVSPSELAPFFRRSLAGLAVAPVEEVACGLIERGRAVVLDVNPWPQVERARDRVLARAANRGLLAVDARWEELPTPALRASLLHLAGAGPQARALCERALAPPRPWRAEPVAVALPEDQLATAGWSRLEIGDELVPRRWGVRPEVTLRFDRPLPPGRYALHLVGHRSRWPRAVEEVCIEPPGGPTVCSRHPEGRFEAVVPFEVERRVWRPRAVVQHPIWSPAQVSRSGDRRWLSVLLEVAWIERRPAG